MANDLANLQVEVVRAESATKQLELELEGCQAAMEYEAAQRKVCGL